MCYCEKVKKFILSLVILFGVMALLVPYFTSNFHDLQVQQEYEENLKKIQLEEQAKKDAEKKIFLLGKFELSQREDFILIPIKYTVYENQMYLRKEVLEAFIQMAEAANKDEIEINIASAARNFDYQKDIWNKKWTGITLVDGKNLLKSIPDGLERFEKILEYSAVPGTSRHHWGTDIDINITIPFYFQTKEGKKVYEWLVKNASSFGFCQTYNLKGSFEQTGYNEEKWHWSYFPLAKEFLQNYKTLVRDTDINGFLGDEYVPKLNLINDYVLDINPECL